MNLNDITNKYGGVVGSVPAQYNALTQKYGGTLGTTPPPAPPDTSTLSGFVAHPIQGLKNAVSAGVGAIKDAFGNAISASKTAISDFASPNAKTGAQKTADTLHAAVSDVGVLFSPINAAFAAADKVPALKQAAALLSIPFTATGIVGQLATEDFIKALPIDQKTKDVLAPAFGEVGSLAGQILLGGRVMGELAKGKTVDTTTVPDILAETKKQVEETKSLVSEKVAQAPIEQPSEAPKTAQAVASKYGGTAKIAGETPSGLAKSIQTKAAESGLTDTLGPVATYEGSTIKAQKAHFDTVAAKGIDQIRAVVRGEAPLPEGAKPFSFIVNTEEYLKKNPTPELAQELINSPLVSQTSEAASILGLGQNREQDSFTAKAREIQKAREAKSNSTPLTRTTRKAKLQSEMTTVNLGEGDLGKLERFIDTNLC